MFKRLALVRLPSGRLKFKQNRKSIADSIGNLRFCSGGASNAASALDDRVRYLTEGIKHGNRGCLAEGITLVETEHRQKKLVAKRLLETILNLNKANGAKNSFRIGLSGPPGAGKSTFIEVIGKQLTSEGHKVAVLAVDPSSSTTGGSLLGDKTRMPELTKDMNAYIRPSPARGHLGGVTRSTNEAIILCEFAGYDTVIVETVGVGQSEYLVTNMVDMFILLLPPGGGDELQGVKRGIVERADLLVVTKSDGDLKSAAHRTQYEYMAALKFIRPTYANWKTKVISVSAKTKEGLENFWKEIESFKKATENEFEAKRSDQRVIWTWTHVQDGLHQMLLEDPNLKHVTHNLISQVKKGTVNPGTAADEIIESFKSVLKHSN